MSTRAHLTLVLLITAAACHPQYQSVVPLPYGKLALDSGTFVRARFESGEEITGHLLSPLDPWSTELRICRADEETPCSASSVAEASRMPKSQVRSMWVRAKLGGNLGLLGLYLGGITGDMVHHDETGGSMTLGTVAGVAVGALIGSRITGWVPLFPCPTHGQCAGGRAWRRDPPAR